MATDRRPLSTLAALLAALAVAVALVVLVPLRVAECGPPDPSLLRYLGTPFFHATGIGHASSLEATIWLGPLLANIALIAAGLFALLRLLGAGRGWALPQVAVWATIAPSLVAIALGGVFTVDANTLQWALAAPDISSDRYTIRFDPFTDSDAWVRGAGQ